ncbi:MAG TPA: RNA polymerase sigma factor [Planctomycetota bacterium]|jgi:RNA polymerase sigma-70 factor (ECF subfamily)|nr:RNA polymerase sigma factor [Planctomycetota bacterium]
METKFEHLIETHRPALLRAALKFCHGDEALAEDMVQETYVKALRHADRFVPGTNLRAWLMRILYNNVMSAYRHKQVAREGPYPEGFDPVEEEPADLEVSDELARAVSDLPEDYRKVFLMAALEDSPYQVIAEKLGIPVGTVMSRLWRARRTLKRRLASSVSLN